jgi:transcriptional regulator with XRE-family HTH domain
MANGDLKDLFATNLRRLRHDRGLSQDDLAAEAGMSRSYLAQLETGQYHVSLKIIAKLSKALNAEPAEFLRQPERPERSE